MSSGITSRRGFTLLEVIVVAAMLVLIGTIAVPRMVGVSRGQFTMTTEGVASAFASFAFQEATDQRLVAIAHLESNGRVDVLMLDKDGEWIPMPMAPSLVLPEGTIFTRVSVDGALQDPRDWFVSTMPGAKRPDIRVRLESENGDGAEIVLTPHGLGPLVIRDGDPSAIEIREPADLDEMGADRESW
jgi:prepilin-type N-terminal cleavage/methylation domain-containing protein